MSGCFCGWRRAGTPIGNFPATPAFRLKLSGNCRPVGRSVKFNGRSRPKPTIPATSKLTVTKTRSSYCRKLRRRRRSTSHRSSSPRKRIGSFAKKSAFRAVRISSSSCQHRQPPSRKTPISSRATAVYFRKIFLIPKPRRQVGAGRVPISTSESRMKLSPIIRSSISIRCRKATPLSVIPASNRVRRTKLLFGFQLNRPTRSCQRCRGWLSFRNFRTATIVLPGNLERPPSLLRNRRNLSAASLCFLSSVLSADLF